MKRLKLNSIKTKLTISNFLILFLLTSFIFFNTKQNNVQRLKAELTKEVKTYLSFISQDLVKIVTFESMDVAADLTSRLRTFQKINQLIVYDNQKKGIFFYTKKNYKSKNSKTLKKDNDTKFIQHSYIGRYPLIYLGKTYGSVYLDVSTQNINMALKDYHRQSMAFVLALVLASILLTYLINRLISNPVLKLTSALGHIAKTGDFNTLLGIERKDEIGDLFSGFNKMQKKLQVAYEDLNDQKFALDKHSIVAITDVRGNITFVNDKFIEISGYSREELIGYNHRILNSGYHSREFFKDMYKLIASGQVWHNVICNKAKDGNLYWVDTTIVPLMMANGKPKSYISIRTDITELKAVQKKAEYLSQHDILTGLPNRAQVEIHLKRAIERSMRYKTTLALVYMDLNKFKIINDTYGHEAGDTVLIEMSHRFKDIFRKVDFLARQGGDEFVAILEDIKDETNLSHLLTKVIECIEAPVLIDKHKFYVGVSMGVSLYPLDADDFSELLLHADFAMYKAKEYAHSNFQFYTRDLNQKVLYRYQLEADLHEALNNRELFCVYQPKVNMISGQTEGAEVLIRWQKTDGHFVPPDEFITVAENCGLINNIWRIVLESSVILANHLQKLNKNIPLAVNISPVQFNYGELDKEILSSMEQYFLPTDKLQIEITEGVLVDGNSRAKEILNILSGKGVEIAIDDFGTGYSSLKYLKDFPIDLVKLDGSFISGIGFRKEDEQLIKTIIDMSHSLGKKVIAEGVETEKQKDFLIKNGCHMAQGYYYSKPLKEKDFLSFIEGVPKVVPIHGQRNSST